MAGMVDGAIVRCSDRPVRRHGTGRWGPASGLGLEFPLGVDAFLGVWTTSA
jgi:hypothetical protein